MIRMEFGIPTAVQVLTHYVISVQLLQPIEPQCMCLWHGWKPTMNLSNESNTHSWGIGRTGYAHCWSRMPLRLCTWESSSREVEDSRNSSLLTRSWGWQLPRLGSSDACAQAVNKDEENNWGKESCKNILRIPHVSEITVVLTISSGSSVQANMVSGVPSWSLNLMV